MVKMRFALEIPVDAMRAEIRPQRIHARKLSKTHRKMVGNGVHDCHPNLLVEVNDTAGTMGLSRVIAR
jgi:hypothetical protein